MDFETLDREMAEVMGWEIYDSYTPHIYFDRKNDAAGPLITDWQPTRSIAQAMMVVEESELGKKFDFTLERFAVDGSWHACFWIEHGKQVSDLESYEASSENKATAICKAARKVKAAMEGGD